MRKRRKYRKEFASLEPGSPSYSESLFFWVAVVATLIGILVTYKLLT